MKKATLFAIAGFVGLWFWSWVIGTHPNGWWVFPTIITSIIHVLGCFVVVVIEFAKKFER